MWCVVDHTGAQVMVSHSVALCRTAMSAIRYGGGKAFAVLTNPLAGAA